MTGTGPRVTTASAITGRSRGTPATAKPVAAGGRAEVLLAAGAQDVDRPLTGEEGVADAVADQLALAHGRGLGLGAESGRQAAQHDADDEQDQQEARESSQQRDHEAFCVAR